VIFVHGIQDACSHTWLAVRDDTVTVDEKASIVKPVELDRAPPGEVSDRGKEGFMGSTSLNLHVA
jgi:hypothetical protein